MTEGAGGGQGICCEERLPLGWRLVDSPPEALEAARLYDAALTRLYAILSVSDAQTLDPSEEGSPRPQDLVRIEARLNLLLALVGELLRAQFPPPAAVPVRLSGEWVEWETPVPPPAGAHLRLDLYLNPLVPAPVTVPARVEALDPSGAGSRVRAVLVEPPAAFASAMEKLVFRFHRRRVAELRRSHPTVDRA
jgi:hypothetical protein